MSREYLVRMPGGGGQIFRDLTAARMYVEDQNRRADEYPGTAYSALGPAPSRPVGIQVREVTEWEDL